MSRVIENNGFPSAIREKLQSIRWRTAGLALGRALAIGVSVLLGTMILAMLADWWLTIFDTGVRTVLTTTSLSLTIIALLYFGVRPIVNALGWARAARNVDDEIPQLEERWTTVASFAHSEHQPESPAAKAMLQQVTSEAVAMGTLVQPRQVAHPGSLKRPLMVVTAVVVGMIVFLASNWSQTSILMQRFWMPTSMITATQLSSVTGNQIVPRGQSIEFVTEMTGLQRSAAVFTIEGESFLKEKIELQPDAEQPGRFICSVDVDESFRYQVIAGDGRTEWHTITAIDFPVLSEVELKVTAPEYTDQEPIEKSLIPGRIRVVQGSILTLRMRPDAPVKDFNLILNRDTEPTESAENPAVAQSETLILKPNADGWYDFEVPLIEDFSFSAVMKNVHGLTNEDRRVCHIHVIADKAPVARIISPNDEMAVSPDAVIEVKIEAHDDFGIAKAELVIYEESEDGKEAKIIAVKEVPLGDQMLQKHVMAKIELDLKELGLKEGSNISYSVRVTDNRMVNLDPEEMNDALAASSADPDNNGNSESGEPSQQVAETDGNDPQRSDGKSAASGDSPEKGTSASETADGKDADMIAKSDDQPERNGEGAAASASSEDVAKTDEASKANSTTKPARDDGEADTAAEDETGESNRNKLVASTDMKDGPEDGPEGAAKADSVDKNDKPSADGKNDSADTSENSVTQKDKPDADSQHAPATAASGDGQDAGDQKDGQGKPSVAANSPDQMPDDSDNPKSKGNGLAAGENEDSKKTQQPSNDSRTDKNDEQNSEANPSSADVAKNDEERKNNNSGGGGNNQNRNMMPKTPGESGPARTRNVTMTGQNNDDQRQRNNTQRLRITERLTAIAASDDRQKEHGKIRDRVVKIDEMLAVVERDLALLVDKAAPEAERSDRYRNLDVELEEIETYIANLRTETVDSKFVFVGLQMVVIATTHVTPARDGVYISIREPDIAPDTHAKEALHHVISARELLDDLLKKYDRIVREQELEEKLNEQVKMYEVIVEKSQQLLRAARENRNPLKRKMGVIDVDQAYLDRYAEVLTMRREMMAEFARILSDDPRLLHRYMDMIKRRRASLRDQLTELLDRQDEIAQEVSGWLNVEENQRENLWMLVSELRLHTASDLAKEAEALSDRIVKSMPLVLDVKRGSAALVVQHAEKISLMARSSALDAKKAIRASGDSTAKIELSPNANGIVVEFAELAAALDQLNFEAEDQEGVTDYVNVRLIEARTVADLADAWAENAEFIERHQFHGLAQVDQQQTAIATELLRIDMLGIEEDLAGQFQDVEMPQEIANLSRELSRVMESITFNQAAATFALSRDQIARAAVQQELALKGFETAQKLFDQLRRKTIEVLDEQELLVQELRDPTLDDFLSQLEREPNIEAQLGIPNRPRNLRVLQDSLMWQQNGSGGMLSQSGEAAAQRARKAMAEQLNASGDRKKKDREQRELTEEEEEQLAKVKDMEAIIKSKMEGAVKDFEKQAANEDLPEDRREKIRQRAEEMKRMLDNLDPKDGEWSDNVWDRLADAENAQAVLKALSAGGSMPDTQWNKIRSTLGDGLWQVRGRTPPEDYRRSIETYQDSIRRLSGASIENQE